MWKALFTAVAVMGMAIAPPASAQQPRHVHPIRSDMYQVDFRDIDLSDPNGRTELMSRIVYASQLVCSQDQEVTRGEVKRCIRASVARTLSRAPARVQLALQDEPVIDLAQR